MVLVYTGILLAIVGFVYDGVRSPYEIVGHYLALLGALIGIVGFISRRFTDRYLKITPPHVALAVVVAVLLSDVTTRGFTFPGYESTLLNLGVVLLTLLLSKWVNRLDVVLVPIALCLLAATFINHLGAELIITDDHPSFYYRLLQLKEHFPNIPFYNTEWNAGVEARDFFPTGVFSPFAAFISYAQVMSTEQAYNMTVLSAVLVLPALVIFCAAWMIGINPLLPALFAMAHNLLWLRYGLSYGTLGFLFSASFLPLLYAVCININRLLTPLGFLIAIVAVILAPSSPLTLMMSAPAFAVLAYFFFKESWALKWRIASLAVLAALLHIPWALIFVEASRVVSFVQSTGGKPISGPTMNASTLEYLRDCFNSYNVTLAILVLFHLFYGRSVKDRLYQLFVVFLFLLAVFGHHVAPKLELERSLVVLSLFSTLSVGLLFNTPSRGRALLVGLAVLGIYGSFLTFSGRGIEKYAPKNEKLDQLVRAIGEHTKEGRAMIAGFTLHEFGGGHVAPLPKWAGVPMIASRFQHDRWQFEDVIPDSFRLRGKNGVVEFLKLQGVTTIITHDLFWRHWFAQRKKMFTQVYRMGRWRIYTFNSAEPSFFLQGSGEIKVEKDSLHVRLDTPDAVIKFNYLPILTSDNCKLEPYTQGEVTFIKISQCATTEWAHLKLKGIWTRVFPFIAN